VSLAENEPWSKGRRTWRKTMLHAFLAFSIPLAVLVTVAIMLFVAIDEMFFQAPRRSRGGAEDAVELPAFAQQPAEQDSIAV
jgi:hypothetical protein